MQACAAGPAVVLWVVAGRRSGPAAKTSRIGWSFLGVAQAVRQVSAIVVVVVVGAEIGPAGIALVQAAAAALVVALVLVVLA